MSNMTKNRFISKSAEILDARKTNENYSFKDWMMFLNSEFLNYGFKGKPFIGEYDINPHTSCWLDHYEFGYTPYQAIAEDFSAAGM